MLRLIAFLISSAFLVYISRYSLRAPRSHGFYRFFTWEFIPALFLLNVNVWFQEPFSWHQLISWFLLFVCIVPLVLVRTLTSQGNPVANRKAEPQLLGLEETSSLLEY